LIKTWGGTTPLDVVIDFEAETNPAPTVSSSTDKSKSKEDDELEDFEKEFEAGKNLAQYWFTSQKMGVVEAVHDYLDSLPETGKVLSLGTMLKVGKTMNDGKPLDDFQLALVYNQLPEKFRKIILTPYVAAKENQARFSIRIIDSDPTLRRSELLQRIKYDLVHKLGLKEWNIHLSGMMVMYN